jgi:hypothetical protein
MSQYGSHFIHELPSSLRYFQRQSFPTSVLLSSLSLILSFISLIIFKAFQLHWVLRMILGAEGAGETKSREEVLQEQYDHRGSGSGSGSAPEASAAFDSGLNFLEAAYMG